MSCDLWIQQLTRTGTSYVLSQCCIQERVASKRCRTAPDQDQLVLESNGIPLKLVTLNYTLNFMCSSCAWLITFHRLSSCSYAVDAVMIMSSAATWNPSMSANISQLCYKILLADLILKGMPMNLYLPHRVPSFTCQPQSLTSNTGNIFFPASVLSTPCRWNGVMMSQDCFIQITGLQRNP